MSSDENQPHVTTLDAELIRDIREIRTSINSIDTKVADFKQSIQQEIHNIRVELLQFQMRSAQLDDVTAWTSRFREQITLTDLERLKNDVQHLKEFKAKSTVVFAVVQFLMATAVAWFTKG